MATYGYARVSTDEQAEADRTSLDTQAARIELLALSNGWRVDRMFIEAGVSGNTPLRDRPDGKALMAVAREGDRVIAAKLDRMFRDASDALTVANDFQRRGVALILADISMEPVTQSVMGKLFFTIVAALAEAERGRIKERLRESIAERRRQGRKVSGIVPFGFVGTPDKRVRPDPARQAAIATIHSLRAEGKSLRAIKAAIQARHGVVVSHVTINAVLARGQAEAA